jgi:hypothetical protein
MPTLPVFVIERETGDVNIYNTMEDVRLIASEFRDILDDDFMFFDATGRRLVFLTHLPVATDPDVHEASVQDADALMLALQEYARTHRIEWTPSQPLSAFIEQYRSV